MTDEQSWILESFPSLDIEIKVPDPDLVKKNYEEAKLRGEEKEFPFWTRIWPASIGLSEYIAENPDMFRQKNVLELGAGIGLPSFVAATYASWVLATDYLQEITTWLNLNIEFMDKKNMESGQVDFTQIPHDISADIILMSDLNYAPEQFSTLHKQINKFVESGSTVLLSSPHRLAGRSFLTECMKQSRHHETRDVILQGQKSGAEKITILLLRKKKGGFLRPPSV